MKAKIKFTLKQNLRYFLAFFVKWLQIFYISPKRKDGISIMIRVKDEEDWIATSLLTLNNFTDEVVIIDNGSTDNTLREIKNVKDRLNYPIILKTNPSSDICEISNQALSLTTYNWIFRWDSDFIGYTNKERNLEKLREYLLSLNQKKYYFIYLITISFAGDLMHVKVGHELHSEGYIHTHHPNLKYIRKGKFEVLSVPIFYKIVRLKKIFFIHVGSAKPLKKLLYRFFWLFWLKEIDKYPDIESFIKREAKEKWESASLNSITISKFKELIFPIRKYEIKEFGEYPELLKPRLKNPPFRIIYKDGEPFSRTDFEGVS